MNYRTLISLSVICFAACSESQPAGSAPSQPNQGDKAVADGGPEAFALPESHVNHPLVDASVTDATTAGHIDSSVADAHDGANPVEDAGRIDTDAGHIGTDAGHTDPMDDAGVAADAGHTHHVEDAAALVEDGGVIDPTADAAIEPTEAELCGWKSHCNGDVPATFLDCSTKIAPGQRCRRLFKLYATCLYRSSPDDQKCTDDGLHLLPNTEPGVDLCKVTEDGYNTCMAKAGL